MPARISRVLNDVLHRAEQPGADSIRVGTPAWWSWLDAETTRSFSFRGATGSFTARKARRRRAGAIAQELIVSEGTVKRHISNLPGKLAVHSRLEAVAAAHSLGLLE
jgi:hypothetical protein